MIRMFWYFKVVIIYIEISSLIFNSNIFLKWRNWFIGKSKSGFLSNSILSIWKEFKILYFEMKSSKQFGISTNISISIGIYRIFSLFE